MSWTDIDAQMAIGMVWKAQDVHTEDSEILRDVRMNRYEMTEKENVYCKDSEGIITVHSIDRYPILKFIFVVVVCPSPLEYRTEFPAPFLFQPTKHHTREEKIPLFQ
jgi:hypothetical protein